jgi:hypothetical protein
MKLFHEMILHKFVAVGALLFENINLDIAHWLGLIYTISELDLFPSSCIKRQRFWLDCVCQKE